MTRLHLFGVLGCVALGLCCAQSPRALANDTSVELSVGGLAFTANPEVSLESKEIAISPEAVNLRYQFINQSANPVTLTVAFPLPDIDLSDPDANPAIPAADSVNFVGFRTKVNGAPVNFEIRQRAVLGDKDVTEAVRAAGLPILPMGAQANRIKELPTQTKERLADNGLLVQSGTDDQGAQRYDPGWTVKTSVVRRQTFPPGQPVTIEHQYRTSVGVSFDTVLRKAVREKDTMAAELKRYRADYCVDESFLKGIDRRAGDQDANVARLQERRISYIFKTGASPAGPIKNFRLVVNKGKADRLVSFCGGGIKRVSPTTFEMSAKDYTPQRDLKILLITVSE